MDVIGNVAQSAPGVLLYGNWAAGPKWNGKQLFIGTGSNAGSVVDADGNDAFAGLTAPERRTLQYALYEFQTSGPTSNAAASSSAVPLPTVQADAAGASSYSPSGAPLRAAFLSADGTTDVTTLSPAQIAALSSGELATLTPSDIGKLSTAQVRAFTPTQVAMLPVFETVGIVDQGLLLRAA